MNRLCSAVLVAAAALVTGCASTPPAPAAAPREPVIVRGDTGATASWPEVVSAASNAEVIFIGENHGHPLGLSTAAKLWSEVLGRSDKAELSMEFWERDEQSRLDEYLEGVTDEKQFRARTQRNDGNFPPGHREVVEAAKSAKRPVIAANAPRPLVRAASKDGYDKLKTLSPDLQRLYRIPEVVPTGRYREDFEKIMSDPNAAHGPAPKTEEEKKAAIEKAFRSQSLWDWTMADSIAKGLNSGSTPICHVVGCFHCDFKGGLVQALDHIRGGTKSITVSFVSEWSDTLRDEDKGRGDFVVYVGPAPEDKKN